MSASASTAALALCCVVLLCHGGAGRRQHGFLQNIGLMKAGHLVVEISHLEECKVANNAIVYSNVVMGMTGKVDFVISGDMNMTRSGASLKEVAIVLTKCREAVSSNTCEYFQTWRLKDDLCDQWNDPDRPWAGLLRSITPRPACPMKQGAYEIHNGTIDLKSLSALPIQMEGAIWKVQASMYDDKGLHFCTDLELEPHRVRD